jgi:ElaB/YqjD/DUF883 family membrane-anchored ribosome-binding protein
MSQNRNQDDANIGGGAAAGTRTTGGAGTGATDAGTTRDTSLTTTASDAVGSATATAQGIATQAKEQAQQVGQKVADAATQAKDFVSDKFKDLQNTDYRQVAEDARDYARQKPGQALLISAAAGFLIGILLRSGGSNRR